MIHTWDDLPDSELRAKLVQHGIHPETADALVARRDRPEIVDLIDQVLDGDR